MTNIGDTWIALNCIQLSNKLVSSFTLSKVVFFFRLNVKCMKLSNANPKSEVFRDCGQYQLWKLCLNTFQVCIYHLLQYVTAEVSRSIFPLVCSFWGCVTK